MGRNSKVFKNILDSVAAQVVQQVASGPDNVGGKSKFHKFSKLRDLHDIMFKQNTCNYCPSSRGGGVGTTAVNAVLVSSVDFTRRCSLIYSVHTSSQMHHRRREPC